MDNKLSIHFGEDKTKTILFSSKNRSKNADKIEIRRHDIILKQFDIVEYLGYLMDCTLSGEQMALKVLGKINGRLKMLYREGKYLGQRLRRMLCNALIQPNFDYACSAWYPNLSKNLKNKLQIAQNKCIRFCLFLGNREGIRFKHFKQINWLPVADRVKQFIAVSVYKFANDLSPKYMEDVFKKTNTRASRFSSDVKLHIPNRNNEYGKNCLSYLGATIWNNIPDIIKQAKTCNTFKHKIKEKLFRDLQRREDDIYVY